MDVGVLACDGGSLVFDRSTVTNLHYYETANFFKDPNNRVVLTNGSAVIFQHPCPAVFNSGNNTVAVHDSRLDLPMVELNGERNSLLVENGGRVNFIHKNPWGNAEFAVTGDGCRVALRGGANQKASRMDLGGGVMEIAGQNNRLHLEPGGVVFNGALNIASENARVTVEAGGGLYITSLGMVSGATLAVGLAAEAPVRVESEVAFQPGVVIAPLNPGNLAGVFPLLSAAGGITGVENVKLDFPAAPGAVLKLGANATVLLLDVP
jgi:hypothetical protein